MCLLVKIPNFSLLRLSAYFGGEGGGNYFSFNRMGREFLESGNN